MPGVMSNLRCIKYFSRREAILGPTTSGLLNLPEDMQRAPQRLHSAMLTQHSALSTAVCAYDCAV